MRPILLSLALLVVPAAGGAQSAADASAAIALGGSHVGALTPLMTPPMTGRRVQSAQLGLRYGVVEEQGDLAHAIAASAIFEVGTNSSITLTAGVNDRDCVGCDPTIMLGLGTDMRVLDAGGDGGASFHVSVSGDAGFARLEPGNASALVLAVGAPVTMSITTDGESGMRVVPYLVPAFGIGQLDAPCPVLGSCDRSGTRVLLGGGIGVWNPLTRVSASLGFNRVVIENARTVYGVNVTIR